VVVHPSSAPLPIANSKNCAYGMPPEFHVGQTLPFKSPRPTMATPVGPMQSIGQTNELELVPEQPFITFCRAKFTSPYFF
jgi:hypothetical protein